LTSTFRQGAERDSLETSKGSLGAPTLKPLPPPPPPVRGAQGLCHFEGLHLRFRVGLLVAFENNCPKQTWSCTVCRPNLPYAALVCLYSQF